METKVITLQEFNEKNLTFNDIDGKVVGREVYEYLKENGGDDYHFIVSIKEDGNKIAIETLEHIFNFIVK